MLSNNIGYCSSIVNKRLIATAAASALKTPLHNFKAIIADLPKYEKVLKRRELINDSDQNNELRNLFKLPSYHDTYLHFNDKRRTLVELRNNITRFNELLRKIPENKKVDLDFEQFDISYLPSLKEIKGEIKIADAHIRNYHQKIVRVCDELPNLIDESVHDKDVKLVEYLNFPESKSLPLPEQTKYLKENVLNKPLDFDHKEIGESLDIIEFKTASKISGNSWYYLLNDGALLEQALIQYTLKQARLNGFKMCIPPSIVKKDISLACGFKPKDQNNETQIYGINNTDLVLTGTAEIPLAALSVEKTFDQKDLPNKLVGVSRAYRAEAGARGKDTKGIYRVHEFTKVELFVSCDESSSEEQFDKIVNFQKSIIESLGLLSRVINIPANDLGNSAYKKYDIEAWMPGRNDWGEITSTSICTDYQSKRFHTKYIDEATGDKRLVHTLNGTAMAVPRVIVAILENFYDAENNCVWIPKVLRQYMDGKDKIFKENV